MTLSYSSTLLTANDEVSHSGEEDVFVCPLSFAQQRLWFLDQLEPGSAAYNIPAALRLTGALKVEALERTLSEIVRRHEILRTTFSMVDGEPVQAIHEAQALTLHVVELSRSDEVEREAEVKRLVQEEAERPFDLERRPLMRATLLKLTDEEHILLITMHHIISDGWSMSILVREVAALYDSYGKGEESPLEELSVQYADYAIWQKEWLQGDVLERQLDYWKQQLAGAATVLELPTDRPRPAVQTYHGARHDFVLPEALKIRLNSLSREQGATLFMTLLAAFQVLLSRYSNQDDVSVGTPIAGRQRSEMEEMIGFFVNTLVLRTQLRGTESFRELLTQVREVCLGAYAHQEMPFEKLVEELQPEREASHAPLFQVAFALQNTPQNKLELPGLRLSVIESESQTAKFDLMLMMTEGAAGLEGSVVYNTDLFDASTINRMVSHFERLLESIAANPDERVATLPLISESERHQLIVEWNDTASDYPQNRCLHELFEAQVERTPAAEAVVFADQSLTYAELNRRANQLAHYLRALNVGPDSMVGLCVERSVEMVVALLAILKAGGTYVPLDPQYPVERLSFMIEDAAAPVLLTQQSLLATLPRHQARVLCLDTEWHLVSDFSTENLPCRTVGDHLAYVIYTSGSTGKPKGVCVTHRAVNRLVFNTNYVSLQATDRIAQVSNSSFDAATFEIWGALLHGAQLIGISKDVALSPHELAAQIKEQRIGVMFLTTALFNQIARIMPDAFNSMRYLLFGGEAVDPKWVREVMLKGAPEHLLHVYGPTENTTFSSWHLVQRVAEGAPTIPIGAPIMNTRIYILDKHQRPVPVGVAGELYLGGDGLAQAYLKRPALTAEKFIPDLFSDKPGARLYRTGDLVRFMVDGQIEFIGRVDQQVKIRGFRIELGEIEAVLNEHDVVRESVVIAREDLPGERRLVGYLVAEPVLNSNEVRAYLKERLPDYMIPSWFVFLDEMPLSVNGKLDRRALPAPEQMRDDETYDHARPRTAVEELVASIYTQILKLKEVDVEESFFEVGGHSLLATQVISRVREAFQVEMPLRTLFEYPTIAELSQQIEKAIRAGQGVQAPAIKRAERDGLIPLSFAQQRLWFLDQLEPGGSAYNVPAAVRLRGRLNVNALERTLSEIIRRHEVLRTTFAVHDGQPMQVIQQATEISLPVIDLRQSAAERREAEATELAQAEAERPFDLERGPLVRASLLKLTEEEHVILLTMHHIISDGWSIGVLIKEVAALYESYSKGEESPLEELAIQYADYSVWQREWLDGEVLERQLDYWKRQLAGAPTALELPTDRPRPAVQSHRGARETFQLNAELSGKLKELSRREGATLFMTLLAAFQLLLSRYSNQEDVCVGTPIAGRRQGETEELIGFFVNTLVMRARVSGAESFRELLGQVREACLGAYGHQEMPFEKLVEELGVERDLSRSPLFQVWFVLQNNQAGEELELPGLQLSSMESVNSTAKYDLTLDMQDSGECLTGILEYNLELFDAPTISRMTEHFRHLLKAIVADPDERISALRLMGDGELRQILVEWNDTASDYSRVACLHELFEAQAERTPDAVAAVFEGEQLSYRELNRRANQLAQHLRGLGIEPETLVGICVERSLEMLVGILGILKAGGAYVPLDPHYPQERLDYMLKDAGINVLLTQQRLTADLPEHNARIVYLDTDWDVISRHDEGHVASGVTPGNLAYVIYTSGSTGQPKGVMITHGAVVNHNFAVAARYDLQSTDRVLQFASLSFDVAVEEIFPTWLCGASLFLRPTDALNSEVALFEFLKREQITVVNLSTPYWNELISAHVRSPLASRLPLRLVAIGGEKGLPEAFAASWAHLDSAARLLNVYGPTETTVTNTSFDFPRAEAVRPRSASVPIGRPLSNTRLYVLDANLRPVAVGVTGQLHISGESTARGYLRRAELTAEKFIPDPFSKDSGARLYRTGDLVRYLAEGEVEFVGRVDEQVKVRGFRIELGEIEALLSEHALVGQAVVVAREAASGDKRLAAYVVREQTVDVNAFTEQVSAAALRAYLKERLPDYMVPSWIVLLEELPLTANGKVDRKRLPAPEELVGTDAEQYVAPRTAIEEVVCSLLSGVLGVERVGLEDDFFELGGHSLLATQVISRVREACGVELPLRALFEHSTAGELAQQIEQALNAGQGGEAPAITRAQREGLLPLSFAQQRLWFLDQLEPGSAAYNVPAAVRLKGALDVAALEQTLSEIVRRHEVLRTTFSVIDGQPVLVIHAAEAVSLPVINLGGLAEDEREAEAEQLAQAEAARPFDLARGPLLRAALLRLAEEEHIVLLTMHHIVSDGWSIGVLIKEVAALYESYSRGAESPLAELAIQYADYAVWQREWLQGEVLERQLGYWRRQLAGANQVLELPADRLRASVASYRGAVEDFGLGLELSAEIKRLSRAHGCTLYMTLLAGFATLLWRYTGQDDILVGTAIAGRQRQETEELIGFFVNTLVLRADLSREPAFAEVLKRVREASLGAYAYQDVPFERLVEEVAVERSVGQTPLFQVAFGVQNAPEGELRMGELEVSAVASPLEANRFELTLWMWEEATGELMGRLTYNRDLFAQSRIQLMARHFTQLFKSAVSDPQKRVSEIEFRSDVEIAQQINEEQELMESNLKILRMVKRKSVNSSTR